MRVLGRAAERRGERLLDDAVGVPERARKLPDHRVGDDHRRELTAREHVGADRDRVVDEVVANPLVDALIASAEQGDVRLARQLVGERVVERPPGRREQDRRERRRGLAVAARKAASTTSTRITIPAPPP